MNKLSKIAVYVVLLTAHAVLAKETNRIQEYRLDERSVYTIPVSLSRITTISFPGPISAIDAANVTSDAKTPGVFQIAHAKESYFFSVRALAQKAATNINVRWNKKTYVLELVESPDPFYSIIFSYSSNEPWRPSMVRVTPGRLLTLLDKAKAYPILTAYHPETMAQVEYLSYAGAKRVLDCGDYEVRLDEAFRFNAEDTLVFRVILRNKSDELIRYAPDGFSLRTGNRTYPQSISDASGLIPPNSEVPAYFAVTGTPDGGRNDLSLKNEFAVLLSRFERATPVNLSEAAEAAP